MSSEELQGKYLAAVRRIHTNSQMEKKRMPILQRESAVSQRQSIKDAATALAALWKVQKR